MPSLAGSCGIFFKLVFRAVVGRSLPSPYRAMHVGRKSPAKRRSSPAPKRKRSSPRRRSRSPASLEQSDSSSKTSFQWREELESLVTVFASRREVHEVLKNVACIMMALAAIPILTHFAGGDVHNCQDSDLLRGAFVQVLSIRLCALSTLLLAIQFYASCSQTGRALVFFIAASLSLQTF